MRPDRKTLARLYIDERQTIQEISDGLAVSYATVWRWLDQLGINRRVIDGLRRQHRAEERRPPREELVRMYEGDRMTADEIARYYRMSPSLIKNWLRQYGIERRPASRGLRNRGIAEPSADDLARLVHVEHRSYREIGALFGVDASAVKFWLDRHGIARPTTWGTRYGENAPAIPDTEHLAALYAEGLTLGEIGARFGVSALPITQRMKATGVVMRPSGWDNGKRFACADGHAVRSTYERRVDDWLSERGIEHVYEPRLPWDLRSRADFQANGWYIEVWGVTNNPMYSARRVRKQDGYREHGTRLVEINHWDFERTRRERWCRLLAVIAEPSLPESCP